MIHHIKKTKKESYIIILMDAEETYIEIQYLFIIKISIKINKREFFQHNNRYVQNPYI